MLNKRTQILFDEKTFTFLTLLASQYNSSVGALVRRAVNKVYLNEETSQKTAQKSAFEEIIKLRKTIKPISDKEIKELINYGRKY